MADVTVRVKQITEGSRDVANFGQKLNSALNTIAKSAAAAAAAGATFKKAFELGRQGAVATQVESSFNRLNETVFKTPNLLRDMQDAAGGTVGDITLMSAALTQTIGTSGKMSQALAAATPELVKMAKAASTINPALGDTTFLLDSLSVAAKRQSRLLADNAGIIVRMDSAVREVHPALRDLAGTYEELPESLRFLNEMLHQGANLLEAAGGAAESAVDPFDRLTRRVESNTRAFKQWLGEGLTPAIKAMNLDYSNAVDDITEKNLAAADSTESLVDEAVRIQEVRKIWLGLGPLITGTSDDLSDALKNVVQRMAETSDTSEEFVEKVNAAGLSLTNLFGRGVDVEQMFDDFTRGAQMRAIEGYEELRDRAVNAADGIDQVTEATREVSEATKTYEGRREGIFSVEGWEAQQEAIADVEQEAAELARTIDSIVVSAVERNRDTIGELVVAYDDLQVAQDDWRISLSEQEEIQGRVDGLNEDLAQSYGEMMVDIISATGGFDEVAANFAVASGTMTETQAEMILRAEEVGTALGDVATAVDDQAISAEQGAQIYAGLVEASTDLDVDIDAALSNARRTIQRFASGDWIQVGDTFTKMLDPAVTAEGEGPVGQVEFKVDDQELDRLREKLGLVSGDVAGINETVVAPLTSPEAIEHMKEISGDTMENLASVNDNSPYAAEIIGNIDETDSKAQALVNKIFQIAGEHTVTFNIQTRGSIPSGPGFQHGGSFKVGGSGGPDSQMVAFMASPGERVDISPRGRGAGAGGGAAVWNGDLIVQGGNPDDVVRALEDRGIISRTRLR